MPTALDDQPRTGGERQRTQIDVDVVVRVVTRDVSRQHAGVRRVDFTGDQRDAHARQRAHREATQRQHVAVATADEDQIPDDGRERR